MSGGGDKCPQLTRLNWRKRLWPHVSKSQFLTQGCCTVVRKPTCFTANLPTEWLRDARQPVWACFWFELWVRPLSESQTLPSTKNASKGKTGSNARSIWMVLILVRVRKAICALFGVPSLKNVHIKAQAKQRWQSSARWLVTQWEGAWARHTAALAGGVQGQISYLSSRVLWNLVCISFPRTLAWNSVKTLDNLSSLMASSLSRKPVFKST